MSLRVLIVDDEALARSRLRRLLGECTAPAAEVAGEAANAADALEWLRRGPVDLALLDIHMPGADGLKLAQVLRSLPDAPRVVFVTAHAQHALQAFEVGGGGLPDQAGAAGAAAGRLAEGATSAAPAAGA
jgi:two-component system response regulator AlgR